MIGYFENGAVESYSLNLGNGEAKIKVKNREKEIHYKVRNIPSFIMETEPLVEEYNKKNPQTTIYYDYIKAKKMP